MEFLATGIAGCVEIRPRRFTDLRGTFVKTFHAALFAGHGLNTHWDELFWSCSQRGVLRGLHVQLPPADHAKLVHCVFGIVWDVALDLRRSSPTYGQHVARKLSADNAAMLYIPCGMAHGFLTLSTHAVVCYAVESVHSPEHDSGVRWDSCGIPWPLAGVGQPIISDRDAALPAFADFPSVF